MSDRLDGNYEEFEGIMNNLFSNLCDKAKMFLRGYQNTGAIGNISDIDNDPIEYSSDDLAIKRESNFSQSSEKRIKLE